MPFNKFVTYLYNAGWLALTIGVVCTILVRLSILDFLHKNVFIYMTAIGLLMMVPYWVYRLRHFNEYKKENKERLITFAVIAVGALLLILLMKHS